MYVYILYTSFPYLLCIFVVKQRAKVAAVSTIAEALYVQHELSALGSYCRE